MGLDQTKPWHTSSVRTSLTGQALSTLTEPGFFQGFCHLIEFGFLATVTFDLLSWALKNTLYLLLLLT